MVKLPEIRKTLARYAAEPLVRLLAATHVSPNTLTWLGFMLTLGAAALIAMGHLLTAGIMVLVAGSFDILDGALARWTNRITRFGGILDSTLDRLSDAVLLFGVLGLFLPAQEQSALFTFIPKEWSIVLVFIALASSQFVSYIRARAEAAGLECQVGLFTRAERVVVLVLGLLTSQVSIALAIIAALSLVTFIQRSVYLWQQTRK
jgi:CDP-diacylglycerol--glycerol-3-phosphate 3-phosphatidyltransferase